MSTGLGGSFFELLGFSVEQVHSEVYRLASQYFVASHASQILEDIKGFDIQARSFYYQLTQENNQVQLDFVLLEKSALVVYSAQEKSRATEVNLLTNVATMRLNESGTHTVLLLWLAHSQRESNRLTYASASDAGRKMLGLFSRSLRLRLGAGSEAQ